MKVSVMGYDGSIITAGEWDEKRIDGVYGKVNGELYDVSCFIKPEQVEEYTKKFAEFKKRISDIEQEQFRFRCSMAVIDRPQ